MKQILCPLCNADQSANHAAALKTGIDFSKMASTLCHECGEPVVILPDGLRKPTSDEYVEMVEDGRLAVARGAWLDLQRDLANVGPPIAAMWASFRENQLEGEFTIAKMQTDHNFMVAAQDIFLSGVTLALALFNDAIFKADTPVDFQSRMTLIEAELKAYKELRSEELMNGN
jgi:hypothetical protein